MNFRRGSRSGEPEINLIPLIDVVLVIIIFLMLTTTFSRSPVWRSTCPPPRPRAARPRRARSWLR